MQPRAVQGMLDFDFICKRSTPSVAGIIYTFGGQFVSKMLAQSPAYIFGLQN
jgi:ATP citrate (pro-S)-lyase